MCIRDRIDIGIDTKINTRTNTGIKNPIGMGIMKMRIMENMENKGKIRENKKGLAIIGLGVVKSTCPTGG